MWLLPTGRLLRPSPLWPLATRSFEGMRPTQLPCNEHTSPVTHSESTLMKSPCKCGKQSTYRNTKSFRIRTYKKHGGMGGEATMAFLKRKLKCLVVGPNHGHSFGVQTVHGSPAATSYSIPPSSLMAYNCGVTTSFSIQSRNRAALGTPPVQVVHRNV
jgi:hypothetical protein